MGSELELLTAIRKIKYVLTCPPGDEDEEWAKQWKFIPLMIQIISLVKSMDLDSSEPEPESKHLISLINQTISVGNSIPDSLEPESQLVSFVTRSIPLIGSMEDSSDEPPQELTSLLCQMYTFLKSVSFLAAEDSELSSLILQIISFARSTLHKMKKEKKLLLPDPKQLLPLIQNLMSLTVYDWKSTLPDKMKSRLVTAIIRIITLLNSTNLNLDSLQNQEPELTSLISQAISLFNSMDFDSLPDTLKDLISSLFQLYMHSISSDSDSDLEYALEDLNVMLLLDETLKLEPEQELISLVLKIVSRAFFIYPGWNKLLCLCPQVQLRLEQGTFRVIERTTNYNKLTCLPPQWVIFKFARDGVQASHFLCEGCNGKDHQEYEKAPVEIKHSLHPKHSLQLVSFEDRETRRFLPLLTLDLKDNENRACYCCDEFLEQVFYYCSACDFAIRFACVQKQPRLFPMDHPKWHEHTLALFPSQAPFPCNLCALTHSSSCPFYICPPCDFVVHQSCLNLPHLIRISRHPHRISFTYSFDQGDWSCGVCRKKMDNDYGGYSCVKDGCSYAAHSKCATQSNVWDGIELEGVPEEIEEELEPFVTISDGVIQHFSHQHHHLRLDENTDREYDEDKLCQACVMPIYFGNFYSCMQCEFILHETCANLSRKLYHPIHPHLLTLVEKYEGFMGNSENKCTACSRECKTGFFYECGEEGCSFHLHVQCATVSEPLDHESHMHPLFLTSKPGERRICSVCKETESRPSSPSTDETFNCIECDFVLCFKCATLPQKVRYKYDKHMLTLSYGEETTQTSTMMMSWCEVCELAINHKERFYACDEYCCVTLHVECMLGKDLYMKAGSTWNINDQCRPIHVLPNNQHMFRPICYDCKKRCLHKLVFLLDPEIVFCSIFCYWQMFLNE
ncbi:PREDICTED: uncharacterized protein LOC104768509 [Camelina sativa]|uniref:Uncharacterized protein LOC104768509 n=1 Tax=Camelina sativa TaxID=90675 RepID=A0ABM0XTG9_CAMSA|nr:PREDICTED: uncharacterized protein LOC104768509 [Camelina sativa]